MITNHIIFHCKIRRARSHSSGVNTCKIAFRVLKDGILQTILLCSSEGEINWMRLRVNSGILTSLTPNPWQMNNWITVSKRSK